ncbi:MAG: hypothetical protein KME10_27990 [Plectolyngbya sp. WJT66-NPBG17]|jgi:septal ring factor EnvC (AmiA/AmiB activator)|nr:hypothetical protein [Plectolyngbya sp. WJT66-NPBG17]
MAESFERQSLKTAVELLVSMRDNDTRNFDRLTASIEALTLNVSQLATQQKATANNLDKVSDRIDRLTAVIERQNATIDGHLAVAQAQSINIAELTRLATAIVTRS